MSSWKQTSGISKYNNADKINTNTLAVNKLILKEPYSGIFSIDGGIDVSGLSQFNDIVVNGESVFQGFVTFNQDFAMNGNVRTQNIYVSESAFFNDSAFLHGHNDGLGLNTENANAAFDISTNLINGFNILSSQNENISVLAQNNQQAGIKLGVDLSSAYIHFFHENPISSNSPDARFQYETGGDLLLDVSNNFAVLSSMSVSQRETDHINNENLVIYDASNGDYFELFYNNTVRTGAALSCVSYDASSNTFAYLTTPEKRGFAIGGGAYPDDIDRSMGVLSICDTSDNKIPSQTVISGSDLVKYRTTTGINTLKPHTEQSVLDVNGPIFVNNNDIHNVTGELGFEVYSMSVAFSQRNNVLALGSPYQIADPRNHNRILKSVDYGASWSLIDVPIGVVGVDSLSSIAAFDASNCLMIGENEFVQSSIDGGLTWTKLDAILPPVLVGTDYSNLIMKRQLRPNGKVIAFFTANDMSYNIYTFDISFGDLSLNQYYPHEIPTGLNVLNSIATNDTNLFGAGNAIVSFITTNVAAGPGSLVDSYVNPPWVDISSQSIYSSGYTYTHIHAHNDLVVAVGPNIISSSSDNGVSWIDVSFNNIDFTNVYAQDALHAIVVGSLANVWFTEDAGVSWNVFDAYLNASGKSNLISTSVMFNTVVMSDENTVLLSNRIQSYIPGSQLGESNIFNVFAPNFANAANNYVLDASGSLRISENLVVGNNLTSYSGIFENLVINGSINIPGSSTNIFGNLIIGNGYSTSSAPANGIIIEGVVGIGTDTPNPAFAVDISGDSYIDGSQIIGSSYSGATAPSDGLLVEGHVGIGLSNPRSSYFLDVGGNSGVRGSQIIGSGSSYLTATAPNDGLLVQGTVGIGTETPDSAKILHVVGDVRIQGNLSTDGSFNIIETDVTTTEILKVVNDGTGPALIVNQTGLQPVMDVQDDGVSCLYIEDGGNVGLGLTNPNHVLDVSGNLGVRGSQILGSNASYITATAPDDGLLVEGTVGIGLVDPSLNFALDVSGNIGIRGSQILGSNASYITATAPDDGLLVEGSVGIGVLVPTRKLDVSGDFFAHDISTNHLSVRDSQTIGSSYITATAPDDGLLVEGSVGIGLVDPSLNFALDVSGNIGIRGSQILGSSASYITATAPDDGLLVEGTVGIGLVDPSLNFALDVSGNIGIRGSQILGSNASYITATAPDDGLLVEGTVGIGHVDPSLNFALDVSGNIGIRGSQILGSGASYITATAPEDGLLVEGSVGIGLVDPSLNFALDVSGNVMVRGLEYPHPLVSRSVDISGGSLGISNWTIYEVPSNNALHFYYKNYLGYILLRGYFNPNGSANAVNFTGQHRTFIENVLYIDASNNQGLIVCANKNTYMSMSNKLEKGNNAITQNESLPLVSLSTKSKDKSCFGVISDSEDPEQRSDKFGNFVTPYEKEDGDTRIYINSVGEGAIWVSNKNGSLETGDYITTSDIPGYGEKQDSEFLANYSVAKITMDCDFNPQPQPKEIILKQEILDPSGNTIYENVLDDNGMLQWTNKLDGSGNIVYEYPYNLRYLDLSGNRYSKEEYNTKLTNNEEVYIAAYVGCTYHCG